MACIPVFLFEPLAPLLVLVQLLRGPPPLPLQRVHKLLLLPPTLLGRDLQRDIQICIDCLTIGIRIALKDSTPKYNSTSPRLNILKRQLTKPYLVLDLPADLFERLLLRLGQRQPRGDRVAFRDKRLLLLLRQQQSPVRVGLKTKCFL